MTFASLCWLVASLISAGMCAAFARLVLGPSLPDRVVAMDVLASMAAGILVCASLATGQPLLLDIALALALITFLGTIALAASIRKGVFK